LKHCRIAAGPDEFAREIEHALEDPGLSPARSELMCNESWEAKADEMGCYFAESLKH
jgi:hypothetical protein